MKKIYSIALAMLMTMGTSLMAQSYKYVKVTAAPEDWTGTYLIVYEADDDNNLANVFNGALEAKDLDTKNNFFEAGNPYETIDGQEVRVIAGSEKIDKAVFTVAKSETDASAYNIKSASGYWIGYDNAEKGEPNLEYSNEAPFDNTISMEEGKTSINVFGKVSTYQLRFNADEGKARFRYHETGKKKSIKFYKQIKDSTTSISLIEATQTAGQVFNILGQPVKSLKKGIYIVNGRKVTVSE